MALSRKSLTWIFVVVAVIIVAIALYFIFRNPGVDDPNESNTPVPPGSSSSSWIKEFFPLNVGMWGEQIKALQTALGITADGKFGNQTKAAVISKGYAVPLSLADYNKIVIASGGAPGTSPGSPIGKEARAKSDITGVFINDSASNPTFLKFVGKDALAGIVSGSSGDYYLLQGNLKVKQNEVYLV